jgi:hypothetical protein
MKSWRWRSAARAIVDYRIFLNGASKMRMVKHTYNPVGDKGHFDSENCRNNIMYG